LNLVIGIKFAELVSLPAVLIGGRCNRVCIDLLLDVLECHGVHALQHIYAKRFPFGRMLEEGLDQARGILSERRTLYNGGR
jgi:hypothetical protein